MIVPVWFLILFLLVDVVAAYFVTRALRRRIEALEARLDEAGIYQ